MPFIEYIAVYNRFGFFFTNCKCIENIFVIVNQVNTINTRGNRS